MTSRGHEGGHEVTRSRGHEESAERACCRATWRALAGAGLHHERVLGRSELRRHVHPRGHPELRPGPVALASSFTRTLRTTCKSEPTCSPSIGLLADCQ